jgi:hypothetical protein
VCSRSSDPRGVSEWKTILPSRRAFARPAGRSTQVVGDEVRCAAADPVEFEARHSRSSLVPARPPRAAELAEGVRNGHMRVERISLDLVNQVAISISHAASVHSRSCATERDRTALCSRGACSSGTALVPHGCKLPGRVRCIRHSYSLWLSQVHGSRCTCEVVCNQKVRGSRPLGSIRQPRRIAETDGAASLSRRHVEVTSKCSPLARCAAKRRILRPRDGPVRAPSGPLVSGSPGIPSSKGVDSLSSMPGEPPPLAGPPPAGGGPRLRAAAPWASVPAPERLPPMGAGVPPPAGARADLSIRLR